MKATSVRSRSMAVTSSSVVRTGPADQPEPGRARTSRYADVRDIAEHLAITERHVRRLVLERRIPHRRIGDLLRFDMPTPAGRRADGNSWPAGATMAW